MRLAQFILHRIHRTVALVREANAMDWVKRALTEPRGAR
jgi:hypothetical protein